MGTANWYKPGDYNAICDICGFEFKASQLRKNWKGLFVDKACFEPRHPQDFIRARKETTGVPWSRPEPTDTEIEQCLLYEVSAYADLGTADCMLADNTEFSYSFLYNLKHGI